MPTPTPTPISQTRPLHLLSLLFGTLATGFGLNALFRPAHALSIFEFPPPISATDRKLVDSLILLYGARDVFVGVAIYAAAYFRNRKTLGSILLAFSGVAFVDGAVVKAQIGRGEWNHWGYAPAVATVGVLLLGVLD